MMMPSQFFRFPVVRLVVGIAGMTGTFMLLKTSTGFATYLWLACSIVGLLVCLESLQRLFDKDARYRSIHAFLVNLIVAVCAVMGVLILFEGYLHLTQRRDPEADKFPLVMPAEWDYRNVQVEGTQSATYWHGKLHVYDEEKMRRTTPFPPRQADRCRVMVVGDSLTYGKGVDLKDTYPSVIEAELSKEYRVEVLNLGVSGVQSAEIVSIVFTYAPQLQPDIILYGVCQNDFLESGEGQGSREDLHAYPFPLPTGWKSFLIERTLSGKFFEHGYNELLMRVGLRADFYANILRDLHDYQPRFTRDVTLMSYFAFQSGLPPIIAMVLDQAPVRNGRGQRVTQRAEQILQVVGMQVIPTDTYYKKYDGKTMKVSPWEGHPNEEAHRIWAEHFVAVLQQHPVLQQYRK